MGAGTIDRWVWAAFLLMLTLSGLIAYVGDYIGRRIGRQRLTFLGLRPKKTAILFTVLTGMLIAGLAATLVLVASEGARQRILTYTSTVNRLQAAAVEQHQRRSEAERLRQVALQQKDEAERNLVQATSKWREAQRAERDAEQRSRRAVQEAAATRQKVERARRELDVARRRRDEAVHRYDQAVRAKRKAQEDELRVQAHLAVARGKLEAVVADLSKARAELDTAVDRANALSSEAEKQFIALERQRRLDEASLAKVRADLEKAVDDRNHLQAEILRLDTERGQLQAEVTQTTTGDLVIRQEGELGRVLIPGRAANVPAVDRLGQVQDRVDAFLKAVERRARDLGAGPDAKREQRYAVLFGQTPDGRRLEVDRFLPVVVGDLAAATEPVWVRALSLGNRARGQTIYYSLRRSPDRLVFADGEVVATTTIDGHQDDVTVARALEAMMREQVNPLAQRRGLLPNPDDRLTVVGPEKWLPALRQIRQLDRPVEVQVVSGAETRSGDVLNVMFRVRDSASG